ncbi:MAG: DeoR/GlpR transcriptional regulator [Verrucomicrobia bacterium]|nr:DeoR/GlpR transcriptional regulator [Verrucomicrobiota bacterium]
MKVEFASLAELSELVDASESTVRRDLGVLESKGSVRRTHGGARLVNPKSDEFTFSARDTHQLDEKEAIGAACAGLIQPNQTIIIDAGTTCYHVARHLRPRHRRSLRTPFPSRICSLRRTNWRWSSAAASSIRAWACSLGRWRWKLLEESEQTWPS